MVYDGVGFLSSVDGKLFHVVVNSIITISVDDNSKYPPSLLSAPLSNMPHDTPPCCIIPRICSRGGYATEKRKLWVARGLTDGVWVHHVWDDAQKQCNNQPLWDTWWVLQ